MKLRRSELLLRVARLFFFEQKSRTAIARKIGVSVTQVSRLLDEARNEGIVSIQLNPPRREQLETALKEQYSCLREAIVVGTESDYVLQTRMLAKTAARYFDEMVDGKQDVGLSGGQTVFEMVKCLPDRNRRARFFPTAILGRGNRIINHIDPIVSITVLWEKSGCFEDGLSFVTVAPLDDKRMSREQVRLELDHLLESEKVKQIHNQMRNLDFVFASLRQFDEDSELRTRMGRRAIDLLEDVGISEAELRADGVVGDLNYSFIDADGRTRDDWRLFLSLQADDLVRMAADPAKRIVVIAGSRKGKVLRAALTGRLLNVLITDEDTAENLLPPGPG